MSMKHSNLKNFIEELIKEVETELDEANVTGNIDGYQTPYAFSDGGSKDKNRKKKIATQLGYKLVDESFLSDLDIIKKGSKDITDFVKRVLSDKQFKDVRTDKEFHKYLKSFYNESVVTESKDDKQKVVDYLIKKGNNKSDAQKIVDKNYDYVSKKYKGVSVSKKAEIISGLQESTVNESKDEVTPKQLANLQKDIKKLNPKIKVYISNHPVTKGKLEIELGSDHPSNKGDDREIHKIYALLKKHTGDWRTGTIFTEGIVNEAKQKRPVNRWLELKNDESMHANKKLAVGLKELKYQLAEVEKFFTWYNKIKTMNELESSDYWKRTNNHIYKIKERILNIAKTIQEIEK